MIHIAECCFVILLSMLTLLLWLLMKPKSVDLDVKVHAFVGRNGGQAGQVTRKLKRAFREYSSDKDRSISSLVQTLVNVCAEIRIAPVSYKQASQTVKAWSHFVHSRSRKTMTFGEFSLCALECIAFSVLRNIPSTTLPNMNCAKRNSRKIRSVFLGGSCNPTTWRKDAAIPALVKFGLEYFNPQTDSKWTPEMLKMEEDYKMSSDVVLYVIDSKTRATASMVEAAFFAGANEPIVLVILDNVKNGFVSSLGNLSECETLELQRSKKLLRHLAKVSGIPVFSNIEAAIQHISQMWTLDLPRQGLDSNLNFFQYPGSLLSIADKVFKSHAIDNEFLLFSQIQSAVQSILIWDGRGASLKLNTSSLNTINDQCLSWDGFCSLIVEILLESSVYPRNVKSNWNLYSLFSWKPRNHHQISFHIYGKLELLSNDFRFVKQLRSLGCRYYMYEAYNRHIHRHTRPQSMGKDSILLYSITPDEFALQTMIQAAYDIGRDEKIVLSISDVEPDGFVDGMKLSSRAVRDYNRGRAYLRDIAKKHGVPVVSQLDDLFAHLKMHTCSQSESYKYDWTKT